MVRLRRALRPLRLTADILVYSRAEVNCWGQQPGSALYWALKEGRIVHGWYWTARVSGAAFAEHGPRQDEAACKLLLTGAGIGDAVIGFHAQQAVEKSLKAVLSAHGVEFRRTHDLLTLLD